MHNVKKLTLQEMKQINGGTHAGIEGLVCPAGKGLSSGKCGVDWNWVWKQGVTQVGNAFVGGYMGTVH